MVFVPGVGKREEEGQGFSVNHSNIVRSKTIVDLEVRVRFENKIFIYEHVYFKEILVQTQLCTTLSE